MKINQATDALIIIDMQHDFGDRRGSLYVKDADNIVEPINTIASKFNNIYYTQDCHPKGHKSFASTYNKKPFDTIEMYGHKQMLWPDHCITGSRGAELLTSMRPESAKCILRKGTNPLVDSYSAFRENYGPNERRETTGLGAMLHAINIKKIFICGLARDYCVRYSALDAVEEGFDTYVLDDLTKSVDQAADSEKYITKILLQDGIGLINSNEIGL